jgi:hypothetical protein
MDEILCIMPRKKKTPSLDLSQLEMQNEEYDNRFLSYDDESGNPAGGWRDIYKFFELEYKASMARSRRINPQIVKQWNVEALSLGLSILKAFQYAIQKWFVLHDCDNPQLMWEKRMEDEAESGAYSTIGECLEALTHSQNWSVLFTVQDFINTMTPEFVKHIISYYYGNDIYFLAPYEEDEDGNQIERDLSQQEIFELFTDFVFGAGLSEAFPIDYKQAMQDQMIIQWIATTKASKTDEFIEMWESNKWRQGASEYSYHEILDFVKKQIHKNDEAIKSGDLNKVKQAINFSLNLEHNFGNLLIEHVNGDIPSDILDELSNLDMSDVDAELDEYEQAELEKNQHTYGNWKDKFVHKYANLFLKQK